MSQDRAIEDERQTFADGVPQLFSQAAQVVTGIAGFSYGFGWVLATRFYGSFGIDPHDAGVDFGWLAIRSFMIGVVGLVAFLCVRWLLRAAHRGKPTVRVVQSRMAVAGLVLACSIGAAAVVLIGLGVWSVATGGAVSGEAVTAVLVCGAVFAAPVLWLRPPTLRFGWNSELWLRGVAGAVSGFVLVALVLLPYHLGGRLAAEVRHAGEVHVPMLPGLPVFEVTRVRLIPVSDRAVPPGVLNAGGKWGSCVLRLGESGGTSLYYVNGVVLRISDQNVTVSQPC